MAKKKKQPPAAAAKTTAPAKKSGGKNSGKTMIIAATVVVVAIIGLVAMISSNNGGQGGGLVTPEEQKYMGRLLPAGYEAPKIGGGFAGQALGMTPLTAADDGASLSLSLSDVAEKKLVSFSYNRPGGEPLPLLAYVKPSGKLFVGVDYCPPCEGEGQRFESGTLTCDTCNTKREPETNAGISGACKLYPLDELPVKVEGDKILLDKSTIDGWTPQPLDRPVGS
jgi:hypothetical protein